MDPKIEGDEVKRAKIPKGIKPILFVVLVLYIIISIKITDLYNEDKAIDKKEEALKQTIEEKLIEQDNLKKEQNYLNSQKFIEDTAREKLGLIYPNDKLFLPKEEE